MLKWLRGFTLRFSVLLSFGQQLRTVKTAFISHNLLLCTYLMVSVDSKRLQSGSCSFHFFTYKYIPTKRASTTITNNTQFMNSSRKTSSLFMVQVNLISPSSYLDTLWKVSQQNLLAPVERQRSVVLKCFQFSLNNFKKNQKMRWSIYIYTYIYTHTPFCNVHIFYIYYIFNGIWSHYLQQSEPCVCCCRSITSCTCCIPQVGHWI